VAPVRVWPPSIRGKPCAVTLTGRHKVATCGCSPRQANIASSRQKDHESRQQAYKNRQRSQSWSGLLPELWPLVPVEGRGMRSRVVACVLCACLRVSWKAKKSHHASLPGFSPYVISLIQGIVSSTNGYIYTSSDPFYLNLQHKTQINSLTSIEVAVASYLCTICSAPAFSFAPPFSTPPLAAFCSTKSSVGKC
jgi:hypothetical protein